MSPFFSIVVACCGVEPYVRECLDSVLNQPFADWECLIGVETSKDKTEEIVREYASRDARFKVFTGPRTGSCSASRNTGVDMATGEYVIFLDGDDTIAEGSLQRLHDKISARPGADLYPCAMRVYDDKTKRELELRDNYPEDFDKELTGPEATLLVERKCGHRACPMLQLTVFKHNFLVKNELKCIHGLRRQDSEFSPRALYLASRVVPLHDVFYLYRIRQNSVGSSARGPGYFLGDWAKIFNSLFTFHAVMAREAGFDHRIAVYWARQWLPVLFYFWFAPENMRDIPRGRRLETLQALLSEDTANFKLLLKAASFSKRIAGWWVVAFLRHPWLRPLAELFFKCYFSLSSRKGNDSAKDRKSEN